MNIPSHARRRAPVDLAIRLLSIGALGIGILAVGVLGIGPGAAATHPGAAGATLQGPQFLSGGVVDVPDDIDGDLYVAAQSVTISGVITGDVIAAAQTITITGTVDGDVRLAAQDVVISGAIARSGTVAAATLAITDAGSIGRDLVGAVDSTGISGTVGRDVRLSAGQLMIDGSVGGDVAYDSEVEARIADGSVAGAVERTIPTSSQEAEVSPAAAIAGWLLTLLYALIALGLVTVAAGLLVPRVLRRVTDRLIPSPWKALLVGFVAFIVVPVGLLILLVTVVGAPLALVLMLVGNVLILSTFLFGAHWLGRLVLRDRRSPVVTTLVGGLILTGALLVPFLNILVGLATVWFGLGAELLELHRRRPWRGSEARDPADTIEPSAALPTEALA